MYTAGALGKGGRREAVGGGVCCVMFCDQQTPLSSRALLQAPPLRDSLHLLPATLLDVLARRPRPPSAPVCLLLAISHDDLTLKHSSTACSSDAALALVKVNTNQIVSVISPVSSCIPNGYPWPYKRCQDLSYVPLSSIQSVQFVWPPHPSIQQAFSVPNMGAFSCLLPFSSSHFPLLSSVCSRLCRPSR